MQLFAARRQREREQAEVRRIRKEVEEEETKYGKKEKFMTASYLEQLKQNQALDEQIRKMAEEVSSRSDACCSFNIGKRC